MSIAIAHVSSPDFRALAESGKLVILVPVGSVEPHGPHLGLGTDTTISEGAARRAAAVLEAKGHPTRIAPALPYGVTECAAAFPGAISVSADALTVLLRDIVKGFLSHGAHRVCLVNNHLEPAHDKAVRAAVADVEGAAVACPLTRKWARTLSDEFKSGACHAGRYETALVMAEDAAMVDDAVRRTLPEVPVSLSEKLSAGVSDFLEMGLSDAYAGAPAEATATEGEALYEKLADMIVGEVLGV